MKNSILLLLICFFLFRICCSGQITIGARSAGMGGYAVGLKDLWSTENNIAALANQPNPAAGVAYENRFLIKDLSHRTILACFPLDRAGMGLSLLQFGNPYYNQSKIGLAYGRKLAEQLQMGIQLNYHRIHLAENYGNSGSISANIGIIADLTEDLTTAAYIVNPGKSKIASTLNESYTSLIRLGMDYNFSKKVLLGTEIEKAIDHPGRWKIGLEYQILETFFLRCGLTGNPNVYCFGFGMLLKDFQLDCASTYHPILGHSPQVSLSYAAFSDKQE